MIQRNDVITKITERIAGRLSAASLASWAFDLFYAVDQGQETVSPDDADALADVLDELMFADEEPFALDDADLRRLIARLQQL